MGDYSALLQSDEDEAVLDCGCRLHRYANPDADRDEVALTFCAMHERARELLDALDESRLLLDLTFEEGETECDWELHHNRATDALLKAELLTDAVKRG